MHNKIEFDTGAGILAAINFVLLVAICLLCVYGCTATVSGGLSPIFGPNGSISFDTGTKTPVQDPIIKTQPVEVE